MQNLLAKARRRGDRADARMLRQEMVSLPSADQNDVGYRRLRYIRYADDHLVGFPVLKAEAGQIKHRLAEFLLDELELELSQENDADRPCPYRGCTVSRLRDHNSAHRP
ncbi:hypothetical protein [Streptomyces sp. NPDC055085]